MRDRGNPAAGGFPMTFYRDVIKWLAEGFVSLFRTPTEDEALSLHSALVSYETQRNGMRQRRTTDIRPIGSSEAMSLYAGQHPYVRGGDEHWSVNIYDGRNADAELIFIAVGGDVEQARARAHQLVDALDGARRL
jgi:hypothetical protein